MSTTASVDGQVTTNRQERLLDPEVSGTFVPDDLESRWADAEVDVIPEDLFEDFIPARSPRWFAVVDGRGRVDWQFTGDGDTALLVLVCTATRWGISSSCATWVLPTSWWAPSTGTSARP